MNNNFFDFVGAASGEWKIRMMNTRKGATLEAATHLSVLPGSVSSVRDGNWMLKGFSSNIRYAVKAEREKLTALQAGLGR